MTGFNVEQAAELEALEGLVASPGWAWFLHLVQETWGAEAFAARIEQAVGQSEADAVAHERVSMLTASRRHIQGLVQSPEGRRRQLQGLRESAQPNPNRWAAHR